MKAADLFDLSGEVALITGASSGLGRNFAKVLAARRDDAPSWAQPGLGALLGLAILVVWWFGALPVFVDGAGG